MREIKFRVWIIEDNKYLKTNKPSVPELTNNWTYRRGEYILEQYTGLKDVDGKEIYEGDILEICTNENIFYAPDTFDAGIVVFAHGSFIVQNKRLNSTDQKGWTFHNIDNKIVTGNIHEKPHMKELI